MKIAAYVTHTAKPREENPLPLDHPGAEGTPHRVVSLQVEVLAPELADEDLDRVCGEFGRAAQHAIEALAKPPVI